MRAKTFFAGLAGAGIAAGTIWTFGWLHDICAKGPLNYPTRQEEQMSLYAVQISAMANMTPDDFCHQAPNIAQETIRLGHEDFVLKVASYDCNLQSGVETSASISINVQYDDSDPRRNFDIRRQLSERHIR